MSKSNTTLAKEALVKMHLIDNLVTADVLRPLTANQGVVLKGFIDSINTLLTSDDIALDELQELVAFIKLNKATLDTLAVANIAGLVDALALKSDTTHAHAGTYEPADITIAKTGLQNVFTAPQVATISTASNALDFTTTNSHELTATATTITVGLMATKKGQEGSFTVHSAENITGWGAEFRFAPDFSAVTPTPPALPLGTMEFWYKIVEVVGVDGGLANVIHVAWAK